MNILRYFFLIPLLAISKQLYAGNDTLYTPSVRFGVDVSGFARQMVEPETFSLEASIDAEWRNNHFAVLEAGMLSVDMEKETHRYQANGYFLRIGHDFNILGRKSENPNDLVLLSVRYGFSSISHEAPFVEIHDPYWGSYHTFLPSEQYRAHWLEAGVGLKTELWRNIFIGWSLRGRLLLTTTRNTEMEPYFIGGFGKSNGPASLSLLYHFSYRIPLLF